MPALGWKSARDRRLPTTGADGATGGCPRGVGLGPELGTELTEAAPERIDDEPPDLAAGGVAAGGVDTPRPVFPGAGLTGWRVSGSGWTDSGFWKTDFSGNKGFTALGLLGTVLTGVGLTGTGLAGTGLTGIGLGLGITGARGTGDGGGGGDGITIGAAPRPVGASGVSEVVFDGGVVGAIAGDGGGAGAGFGGNPTIGPTSSTETSPRTSLESVSCPSGLNVIKRVWELKGPVRGCPEELSNSTFNQFCPSLNPFK